MLFLFFRVGGASWIIKLSVILITQSHLPVHTWRSPWQQPEKPASVSAAIQINAVFDVSCVDVHPPARGSGAGTRLLNADSRVDICRVDNGAFVLEAERQHFLSREWTALKDPLHAASQFAAARHSAAAACIFAFSRTSLHPPSASQVGMSLPKMLWSPLKKYENETSS